jgi:Ca-activated chloride channel family protein
MAGIAGETPALPRSVIMQKLLWKIQTVSLIFLFLNNWGAAITFSEEQHPVSGENVLQNNFNVRVDVNLVTTDVTVFGKAVSELRADDFAIYDNDVAQQVSHFSRDKLPIAAALLVDSRSPVYPSFAEAALRNLKPHDQIVLFSFDEHPRRLSDLTEDRDLISRKISGIKAKKGSNILDTLYDAAHYLKKNARNRRRAVILISDACNLLCCCCCHPKGDARMELLESGAAFYDIRVTGSVSIWLYDCVQADDLLKQFADETGGEVLDVRTETAFESAFDNLMSSLRLQYTLGFNPSNPGRTGSWHKLAVRLAAPDHCPACRVKSRSGYYAGLRSSSSQ